MELASTVTKFRGHYGFLSNFYRHPFAWSGGTVTTAEHAFQAEKTLDPTWQARILAAPTAREAKALGRACPKRPDWEAARIEAMRQVLKAKFQVGTVLAERLEATGNRILQEGNTWGDTFWGICNGVGSNWLGQLLMEVRSHNRLIVAGAAAL